MNYSEKQYLKKKIIIELELLAEQCDFEDRNMIENVIEKLQNIYLT